MQNHNPYQQYNNPPHIHPQQGYTLSPKQVKIKEIRRDCNHINIASIGFFVGSTAVSVLIIVLSMLFTNDIYASSYSSTLGLPVSAYYFTTAITSIASIGLPFAIFMSVKKENYNEFFLFENSGLKPILYVIAGFGLCLFINIPLGYLQEFFDGIGLESPSTPLPTVVDEFGFFSKLFAIAVIPALFEEFAFRGVFLSKLKKHGTGFALVTSSVVFGVLHAAPISIIFATLAGLIMGYVYVKTNNLWASIAVHFLNNGFAVVQEELYTHYTDEAVITMVNMVFYAVIAVGVICAIILIATKNITEFKNPTPEIGFGSKIGAFLINPSTIIFFIMAATSTILTMVIL